jgi:hypothetical protein
MLYLNEKRILHQFKEKLAQGEPFTVKELQKIAESYEDLISVAEISIKIIDNMVQKQNKTSKKKIITRNLPLN